MTTGKTRTAYITQRMGKRVRLLEGGIAIEKSDGTIDVFLDRMPVGGFSGHIHIPRDPATTPSVKDLPATSPFDESDQPEA
jgi:hypothetical protein